MIVIYPLRIVHPQALPPGPWVAICINLLNWDADIMAPRHANATSDMLTALSTNGPKHADSP